MSAIAASGAAPSLPRATSVVPIRDLLCDSQNGISKRTADTGEPVPVLRLANVVDGAIDESDAREIRLTAKEVEKYALEPGDLLCIRVNGSRNLVGRVVPFASKRRWAYCDHFIRLRPDKSKIDPRYLAHYLNARVARRQIELNMVSSAGQNTVSQATMLELPVPLPNLARQREIVAEIEKQFSRLDEAMATLKGAKARLKHYRDAVLSSAVSGGMTMGFAPSPASPRPDMAPNTPLSPGWTWVAASDVCEVIASGSTPKPDEMTAGIGEVPFIKVYNLTFDRSLDFTIRPTFIDLAIHKDKLRRSCCRPGDVLTNIVGPPLGKVSIVSDQFPEWNINQAIVMFRAGPLISNRLLAYWLMSPPIQRRLARTAKATAGQFNVQVSTCRKLVLPLPPVSEQYEIVTELDRRLSNVCEVEAEVDRSLKRGPVLRQAILARTLSHH